MVPGCVLFVGEAEVVLPVEPVVPAFTGISTPGS